jgi:putative transposase
MIDNKKFQNKYRIQSARLQGYDYSSDGGYFVTICTKNREHYFGEIVDEKMKLSKIGEIVADEWLKTKQIRKNVQLGEWVVMPNHIHGIVIIDNDATVETHCNNPLETHCNVSPQYKNKFGPQSHNLSAIIRGFKGTTTKKIHIAGFQNFTWQSRFHDRIIRNDNEFNRISNYIINNPKNWGMDKNNK